MVSARSTSCTLGRQRAQQVDCDLNQRVLVGRLFSAAALKAGGRCVIFKPTAPSGPGQKWQAGTQHPLATSGRGPSMQALRPRQRADGRANAPRCSDRYCLRRGAQSHSTCRGQKRATNAVNQAPGKWHALCRLARAQLQGPPGGQGPNSTLHPAAHVGEGTPDGREPKMVCCWAGVISVGESLGKVLREERCGQSASSAVGGCQLGPVAATSCHWVTHLPTKSVAALQSSSRLAPRRTQSWAPAGRGRTGQGGQSQVRSTREGSCEPVTSPLQGCITGLPQASLKPGEAVALVLASPHRPGWPA